MKILKLKAENVKRVKAIEITPQGNTVIISGANAQGKTSVLDAIWLAVGGGKAAKDSPDPIRKGQRKAKVTVDLGEIKVTRTWTPHSSQLIVENANGEQLKSPQALLDSFIGQLSFDPLEFAEMSERQQYDTLLSMVGLDVADMDAKRKAVYDERTAVNRQLKREEAALSQLPVPSKAALEYADTASIIEELDTAMAQATANKQARAEVDALHKEALAKKERVESLKAQLATEEAELNDIITRGRALKAEVEALVDPAVEEIKGRLQSAEAHNREREAATAYQRHTQEMQRLQSESDSCTGQIDEIDEKKRRAIKEAALPITGLSLNEQGIVTYNDIPFKQCSSAEQLRVSLAMAMALNPRMRVLRITNGSLLDEANLQLIRSMVDEHDFQIWIEIVDESGKLGVYIEDGQIAN